MAIAFNQRGRPGPPARFDLPLTLLAEPPAGLVATYTEESVILSWEPSGGVIGFILDRALPMEDDPVDDPALLPESAATTPPAPSPDGAAASALPAAVPPRPIVAPPLELPAGPTRYLVYREIEPDPLVLPQPSPASAQPGPTQPEPSDAPSFGRSPVSPPRPASPSTPAPWQARMPVPLNPAPTTTLTLTDTLLLEREQCYRVRAVRGVAPNLVAGEPSERRCIRAVDVFPPSVPTGLSAVAGEGSISLIWEPNIEDDLGGYVVLRGEAGGATLQPVTTAPIVDARYTDRSVTAGVRYVYAVVAVDNRVPVPNASPLSPSVEETAR
jgi:hypothetical protein